MKWTMYMCFFFLLAGCDNQKKEQELAKRDSALNQKEQELLLKEKDLQLKEEELSKIRLQLDSTLNKADTGTYNPVLAGAWVVKMNCTETTCPGSAVGDTKTEQWQISYENKNYIAKAFDNGKLIRVYSGVYKGATLELIFHQSEKPQQPATAILVRVQQQGQNKLAGTREITRPDNCKILYAVELVKQ